MVIVGYSINIGKNNDKAPFTYSSEPFTRLQTSTAYFVNGALTSIIIRAFGYGIGYIHRFENCNYLLLVQS